MVCFNWLEEEKEEEKGVEKSDTDNEWLDEHFQNFIAVLIQTSKGAKSYVRQCSAVIYIEQTTKIPCSV